MLALRAALPCLAALVLAAAPAVGGHCETWSTSEPEVDVAGAYYVDVDNDPDFFLFAWFYCESNGIDGLQRGDSTVDDTCHWMIEPDGCQGL